MTKHHDTPSATSADETTPPWGSVPAAAGPGGELLRLVRLADVVRWLMRSQNLQFVPAVLALHEALAGLEGLALYFLDKSGLSRAVGPGDTLELDKPTGRNRYSKTRLPLPPGVTPGQSAALFVVRNVWGCGRYDESAMEHPESHATYLAMPCEQAAALWGGAAVPGVDAGPDAWDGHRLLARQTELKGQGVRDYTQHLVRLSGLEETEIRRRIRTAKGTKPASPMSAVVHQLTGTHGGTPRNTTKRR